MSKQELYFPFSLFFGLSVYTGEEVEKSEGFSRSPVDLGSLSWEWYRCLDTGECVRAVFLEESIWIQGIPPEKESSAIQIYSAGQFLVHSLRKVYVETEKDMGLGYRKISRFV